MQKNCKVSHRTYFKQYAAYQEVADIKDKEVLRWIHVNYRLLYLRDCALAHYLDEKSLNLITIVINFIDFIKNAKSTDRIQYLWRDH